MKTADPEQESWTMTEYGWFDSATQTQAVYDPGVDVACPVCTQALERPVKTISFLVVSHPERSYFFRAHKQCWEGVTSERQGEIESQLVDAIAMGVQ